MFLKNRFILAIYAVLVLLAPAHARADVSFGTLPFVNLSPDQQGDKFEAMRKSEQFAKTIIAQYKLEAEEKHVAVSELDPIVIVNLGQNMSASTKWIFMKLVAAKIPTELSLLSESDVQHALAQKGSFTSTGAPESPNDPSVSMQADVVLEKKRAQVLERTREMASDAGLFVKTVFNLPGGFTAFSRVKGSDKLRKSHATIATVNALISGATTVFTFAIDPSMQAADSHPLHAALAVAAITWGSSYNINYLNEVMSMVKTVKKDKDGKIVATDSRSAKIASAIIRALITTAFTTAATYGLENFFSHFSFEATAGYTVLHLFARTIFDEWSSAKKPTITDDGKIVVKDGQMEFKKWLIVDTAISLGYVIPKILALSNLVPSADSLYFVMATIGAAKIAYTERHNIADQYQAFKKSLKNAIDLVRRKRNLPAEVLSTEPKSQCSAMLMRQSEYSRYFGELAH